MRHAVAAAIMIILPVFGLFSLIWFAPVSGAPVSGSPTPAAATGQADGDGSQDLSAMMTAKPVSFFQNHCMTCHGPYGSWYESESAYGPQEHRELIRQMITGQANTTLDDEHQEIQYHLYRAMAAKSPFLAVSSRQETITTGEFLPGSEVTASVNGKAVPVTISGHTFIIPANARGMTIVGTTGGQTVILHADRQTFTAKE